MFISPSLAFPCPASLLCSQLLTCQLRALDSIGNLLKCHISCKVRTLTVLWLNIDGKRRESAVIRRAQLVDRDILGSLYQGIAYLLRSLDSRV